MARPISVAQGPAGLALGNVSPPCGVRCVVRHHHTVRLHASLLEIDTVNMLLSSAQPPPCVQCIAKPNATATTTNATSPSHTTGAQLGACIQHQLYSASAPHTPIACLKAALAYKEGRPAALYSASFSASTAEPKTREFAVLDCSTNTALHDCHRHATQSPQQKRTPS
jgi:hypothetical protein